MRGSLNPRTLEAIKSLEKYYRFNNMKLIIQKRAVTKFSVKFLSFELRQRNSVQFYKVIRQKSQSKMSINSSFFLTDQILALSKITACFLIITVNLGHISVEF